MRTYRCVVFLLVALFAFLSYSQPTVAEDTYFVKPVADLDITEGTLPDNVGRVRYYGRRPVFPYAVLDGDGEAYVGPHNNSVVVAAKAAAGKEVTGRLFLPADSIGPIVSVRLVSVRFSIVAAEGSAEQNKAFLETKLAHYQRLLQRDLPGAAWFRHQVQETSKALGRKQQAAGGARQNFVWRRQNEMIDTYALFSGGRAVSENLQLDRILPAGQPGQPTVPLGSLGGITVREFDWKPLIKDVEPATDPLAALVPFDQYAIFFPTFQTLMHVADHVAEKGTPVLRAAEPRSVDARTRARYEKQLCLPASVVARLMGPQLVASVAMTGGDPYLRTGADVAVLFEAKNARGLRLAIDARVAQAAQDYALAKAVSGEIAGVHYSGMRSPDRVICSYVATLGNAVVVTNSLAQLDELVQVHQEKKPSLATLDEYTFFRDRYRRGDEQEMALLILSDATIRRWCGPKWRIATSRRTRAAAAMAEIQAAHLDRLVDGTAEQGRVEFGRVTSDDDSFTLMPGGVQSEVHGTLAFHTPIIEHDFTHVTQDEANFYRRWRDGYQRNWSNFFDPIAVRFYLGEKKMAADLTVMPLIDNSEYKELIAFSSGAKLGVDDADPHGKVLVHAAMALNTESEKLKQYSKMLALFAPQIKVNPLSWLGDAVAVYVDDDPLWAEMAKAEDPEDFVEENIHRLPVAFYAEVKSVLRLTAFLAGMRAYIEQTAPGNIEWESLEYNGQPYVRISPTERARRQGDLDKVRIYYAASGDGLILTLSEDLLKRALDRQKQRREARDTDKPVPPAGKPWLGESLCIQVNENLLRLVELVSAKDYQRTMQNLAWGNLAILNEWKRQYPKQDSVKLHETFWHRRLVCPGGGKYSWNDKWQTMESTVYGHPGEPKLGPTLPVALHGIGSANFGVTFEPNGLRARAELHAKPLKVEQAEKKSLR